MRMVAVRSCELDQLAFVKIGERFAHIGGKGGNISVIFFGKSRTISPNVWPSQRERNSCAVSFNSTMPLRKSKTVLPVAGSSCSRTPLGICGLVASEVGV